MLSQILMLLCSWNVGGSWLVQCVLLATLVRIVSSLYRHQCQLNASSFRKIVNSKNRTISSCQKTIPFSEKPMPLSQKPLKNRQHKRWRNVAGLRALFNFHGIWTSSK